MKKPVVYDLIKNPEPLRHSDPADAVCRDYGYECAAVSCALTCWLKDPLSGICPIMTGGRNA